MEQSEHRNGPSGLRWDFEAMLRPPCGVAVDRAPARNTARRPRAIFALPSRHLRSVYQLTVGRGGPQPLMDRLTAHAVAMGHVGDSRPAIEELQHRLMALSPPDPTPRAPTASSANVGANDHSDEGGAGQHVDPLQHMCVTQVPGSVSTRYRGGVRKVSTSYRGHGVIMIRTGSAHPPCQRIDLGADKASTRDPSTSEVGL